MRKWNSRFDHDELDSSSNDPLAAMASLVDVMLVFACGLMAALFLAQHNLDPARAHPPRQQRQAGQKERGGQEVQKARALSAPPRGMGDVGGGYHPVGRVYRDPTSGKLILVETPKGRSGTP